MDIIEAVVLALLQGLTEFLPISSSAHLILMPVLTNWEDQGLAFDVAVHVGTLTAVVAYYRKDLVAITGAWFSSLTGKPSTENSRLAWYVILGTIPVGLVGISLPSEVNEFFRSPLVIAAATIVFALLLWWSEKTAKERRTEIILKDALIVGLFQALALIPGTSRSGITITAGLITGLQREQAARFSFLLSIPTIALAGMLVTLDLINSSEPVQWEFMAIGALVSAVVAYLTIGWFLRLLDKVGVIPFVWYRLFLGFFLIAVFF